jgi:ABC-type multidrug transport system ATPase subunit
MSNGRIKIQHFGPIKEGYQDNEGWIDINKVTVFVGNQGSGKSTVAKLISTFVWIEKAIVQEYYDIKWFERKNRFKNQFLSYHRLENYLFPDTVVEYEGNAYSIVYSNSLIKITKKTKTAYPLPQIMYVPAERNFLTYIKGSKELKLSSEALQEFNTEYSNAKDNLTGIVHLPINDTDVEYNKQYDNLYIKGSNYKLEISEASSGFQSFIPLHLVSTYLAHSVQTHNGSKDSMSVEERTRFKDDIQKILNNDGFTDEQKRLALSALSAKINKTAFVNIVEEPEQNLFPTSQWQMMQSLLELNNTNVNNKLILTTHSPYLISYLTLLIKADQIKTKIQSVDLRQELAGIVALNATIKPDDLSIYELDESDGSIHALETYEGLPSDENTLNMLLDDGNEKFAQLLNIQKRL